MKIIIALFSLLILSNHLFSQDICNDDLIMAVKGKWVKRPDNSMKSAVLSQITTRIDKMQRLLQEAYPEPKGIEARWYRTMGGHHTAAFKNSVEYELTSQFYTWYCNTHVKKLLLGIEASNGFNIWINKFKWLVDKEENFTVDNNPVYLLNKREGELHGFPLFDNGSGTSNTGTFFARTILISRAGQLPYIPVTKKQYLTTFLRNKEDLQKLQQDGYSKTPVRSDAEEEAFKQQQLNRVVNAEGNEQAKEKARTNFLRGYTTQKQRKQADIERSEKAYQNDIKFARDYLTGRSESELAEPAYVKHTSFASSFKEFGNEDNSRLLVQVNKNYFNMKLAPHIPQFLIVHWAWNTEKPSLDFASQIENNFDFKTLQGMLDK